MKDTTDKMLFDAAQSVRQRAHAPYSDYKVGAAVLDDQGRLHIGGNVVNASYPEGICAETNAIGSMIAAGGTHIVAIAVVGGAGKAGGRFADIDLCTPCGGCRQRILEFADADTRILMRGSAGVVEATIDDLLPDSFRPGNP
ncbi:MAG: cytidine deaminase [Pseudomonadota bacterium]